MVQPSRFAALLYQLSRFVLARTDPSSPRPACGERHRPPLAAVQERTPQSSCGYVASRDAIRVRGIPAKSGRRLRRIAAISALHCTPICPSAMMPHPDGAAAGRRERMKNRITGRSAFLALLKDEGITHLFGNPGTTELPIMHALKDHPDLTYVMAMQESLVVAIADGFSRASGRLVACNVHVAPGLGNAMGSL